MLKICSSTYAESIKQFVVLEKKWNIVSPFPGTAFTAVWENVTLQDKPDFGKFTFSVTLYQSGDIVFAYMLVPTNINSIQDKEHPVKVGLSDAYIIDKQLFCEYYSLLLPWLLQLIGMFFTSPVARRKTIYEYHRVTFQQHEITNNTIIKLAAQPTCLGYNDCNSCINHNTTFTVSTPPFWVTGVIHQLMFHICSAYGARCWIAAPRVPTAKSTNGSKWVSSAGLPSFYGILLCDLFAGCEATAIHTSSLCPALGDKGNNAAGQGKNGSANSGASANGATNTSTSSSDSSTPVTEPSVMSTRAPHATAYIKPGVDHSSDIHADGKVGNAELSKAEADNKNVGVAFGFMVPICLVFAVTLWLFYAYRNPHTKSGQLLIQVSPLSDHIYPLPISGYSMLFHFFQLHAVQAGLCASAKRVL